MGSELGKALRSLCCGGGWCYGVLWRFDRRDLRSLKMEESYCEDKFKGVIELLLSQIHIVGEGTIGEVAISGKHKWICDAYCTEGSLIGINNWSTTLQTTVIISLPSFGVIQFGSSQEMFEDLEFIMKVRRTFQQLHDKAATLTDEDACKRIHNLDETFAAVISTGVSSICSLIDTDNSSCKEHATDILTPTALPQNPRLGPHESHHGARSYKHKLNSHVITTPLVSSSSFTSQGFSTSFPKATSSIESSLHLKNQIQAANARARAAVPPRLQLSQGNVLSHSSYQNNLVATQLSSNTGDMEATLSRMEERMVSGMQAQVFYGLSANSVAFHRDADQNFCGNSINYCSSLEVLSKTFSTSSSKISESDLHGAGMLPEFDQFSSSSFLVTKRDPSSGKSFSRVPFIDPELPNRSLSILQGSAPEYSKLVQLEGDSSLRVRLSDERSECPTTKATNGNPPGCLTASSGCIRTGGIDCNPSADLLGSLVGNKLEGTLDSIENGHSDNSSYPPNHQSTDNDLFDGIELDLNPSVLGQEFWDDILIPSSGNCSKMSGGVSECFSELEMICTETAEKQLFSGSGVEELLNAVVGVNDNLGRNHSWVANDLNSAGSSGLEHQFSTGIRVDGAQANRSEVPLVTLPHFSQSLDMLFPEGERNDSSTERPPKSKVRSWVANSNCRNGENLVVNQAKRPDEAAKVVKKRARPGESTRPRPKDRQQIQDRVKELREIVPNSAKCSIDALLDRTIKHMLYLQSVTKYADKLKQVDEPKIIGQESGVVLKDNSSGDGGGATWAFEVAGQTMVCPIIVEDLNPPGQMLVEMLCEERGFFLEIADIIRGFGLIILKGVMEVRDSKIWARFLVEANRDVTRMDIFLSLVQLLQQTSCVLRTSEQQKKVVDSGFGPFANYHQSPQRIPISLADNLK